MYSKTKKQNIFFRLFKLLVWIIVIWWIIIYNKYSNFPEQVINNKEKIITINKWENLKSLAKKLWVNYYFLKKYTSDNNPNFKLLAGKYKLKENSKIKNLFEQLKKPLAEKQVDITILEWWNIYDIDDYLTKKWYIKSGDYISYVQNPEKIKALSKFYKFISPNLISLEWFLYPDSYKIKYPVKINQLVIKQLDNFEKKVYNKILQNENPEEIYKIVNLASIVEKEEKNSTQKPIVAGILKYRLDNNWNIWADITVCYPHKLTSNECKMVVSKYIREKSDYNTRTMIWLPKTPIWNPSFDSINATLNYKKTPYRYYLHNIKTGKIYYARTNAEHEANKKFMYK